MSFPDQFAKVVGMFNLEMKPVPIYRVFGSTWLIIKVNESKAMAIRNLFFCNYSPVGLVLFSMDSRYINPSIVIMNITIPLKL